MLQSTDPVLSVSMARRRVDNHRISRRTRRPAAASIEVRTADWLEVAKDLTRVCGERPP